MENTVAPILRDEFKTEVDKAVASHQEVLQCDYPAFGLIQHLWLWYKSAPANVKEMLKRVYLYNGAMAHMGISGRNSCPGTLGQAKKAFGQLTTESGPFLSRLDYNARTRQPPRLTRKLCKTLLCGKTLRRWQPGDSLPANLVRWGRLTSTRISPWPTGSMRDCGINRRHDVAVSNFELLSDGQRGRGVTIGSAPTVGAPARADVRF